MNEHVQTATSQLLFNPLAPEVIRNPYPYYERLRTTDPMHLTPLGMYVASRHAEVSLVLRDKRFGKEYAERTIRRYGPKIMEEPVFRNFGLTMLQQDPPDHTRLRGLVVKAFTARRVEDMRPRIQQVVDETLDRIEPQGLRGTRKVHDVFIDRKLPRDRRTRWPIVVAGNEILWIPAMARSRHALVTPETRKIQYLRAIPAGKSAETIVA